MVGRPSPRNRQSGVAFTDNGNDPGPVVAKLAAGNANDIYDVGGLQGGSEKELAKQGLIAAVGREQDPELCERLAMGEGHSRS